MADFDYPRYLAAKQGVDDRALNRRVFRAFVEAVRARQLSGPVAFLEAGCGIGTMVERLWAWGLLRQAEYTGLDLAPEHIAVAAARLPEAFRQAGLAVDRQADRKWRITGPALSLDLTLEAVGVEEFAAREAGRRRFEVLLAHAFLDLVDPDAVLPALFGLLKPGGLFYFTLNFDGATIFLPEVDPELDALVEDLYHQSMQRPGWEGRVFDGSRTGRRLFGAIPKYGGRLLAAGPSDWVVFPAPGGYTAEEAYFLACILSMVEETLRNHPGLLPEKFHEWSRRRREQLARGELIYLAHQLDFFGSKAG